MSHGFELNQADAPAAAGAPAATGVAGLLHRLNGVLLAISMVAMVVTALILTYSVISRYFFHAPTDWQDEISVFLLVGATFFSAAHVQARRGHIGIEAIASILPASVNRIRLWLVDLVSFLFCAFFTWKSWTLCHEAWADGQTTSSTLAPPLWIPYSLMAFGMTLLTLQILLQLLSRETTARSAA